MVFGTAQETIMSCAVDDCCGAAALQEYIVSLIGALNEIENRPNVYCGSEFYKQQEKQQFS